MALKPCKECGQDASTKAKACPSCGVRHPTRKELSPKAGAVVLFALFGLVAFALLTDSGGSGGSSGSSSSTPTTTPRLDARVQLSSTQLTVTNTGNETWRNCEVVINPGLLGGGYSQDAGQVPAGEQIQGGLMAFTASGGERFNPGTHAVETVDVRCDVAAGRAWYTGAF